MRVFNITIQTFLSRAKDALSSITDEPMLEAEILLAHVLNQPRSFLRAWPETTLTEEESNQASAFISRRMQHEPIAYIIGHREFWSLDLAVNTHTLIPRPETELLVESALAIIKKEGCEKIADLGTGSGAIALALGAWCKSAQIFAVDASHEALQMATYNAKQLGLINVSFYHGNWCSPLPGASLDMIISNPPYLTEVEWQCAHPSLQFEPYLALASGIDGLDAIREIAHTAKCHLKSGGYLLVEHGSSQGPFVRHIFASLCYANIYTLKDLSGQERVTIAKYF